ncbi:hypothetical protein QFC19_000893 [Naganishia cerealis]|uniref:Uncharacterized protein n=1 Tax=Naganishia cerealis TaxID=610337 RepID=A0ACC2WMC7_9TREE|nr:hypothetical protein QFC19_000893 [Naganishia cerealis]
MSSLDLMVLQEAVFIGANTQANILDYDPASEIVAYGAGTCVAIWKPIKDEKSGVYSTLKGHSRTVTGVKFVPETPFLVSIGEDDAVIVWKQANDDFSLFQTLKGHTSSVTSLAVVDSSIFATGGADGNIILWGFQEDNWTQLSNFQVQNGFFPLTIALQQLYKDSYILVIGGTNSKLYVYSVKILADSAAVSRCAVLTGHEDWIKALSFVKQEENNYILASGSQDRYIRLWRVKVDDKIDDADDDDSKLILLSNKQHKFQLAHHRVAISFDALLMGHDDWVSGLQWNPQGKLQLASSSADTAVMIWEMDKESGIWCSISRLGEMSIKGASTATGASGGFWSCLWFAKDDIEYIMASGKTGAIRTYCNGETSGNWNPKISVSGPVREVTDVKWSNQGFFMATSLDQTTRLYAQWAKDHTWHEFARPQIHGYDMVCLDHIDGLKFVSGGEEKVLRVFEMTKLISQLLQDACGVKISSHLLPESASLPVLGLSNKAEKQMEAGDYQEDNDDQEKNDYPEEKDILPPSPPLEDYLQRHTLFPEQEKLYGHGYEISSVAVSPNGNLIASTCRSNTSRHAVIRVFNAASEYQQSSQLLEGHNLTVTSLRFSSDGQYLLAVSRDRQLSVWKVVDETKALFELVELNSKAHTKIIWDCCWVKSTDHGHYFLTGSRDKLVKLWKLEDKKIQLVSSMKLQDSVTAVDCDIQNDQGRVVAGMESGAISLLLFELNKPELVLCDEFDEKITPAARVSRVGFNKHRIAVGSWDNSVRIYRLAASNP